MTRGLTLRTAAAAATLTLLAGTAACTGEDEPTSSPTAGPTAGPTDGPTAGPASSRAPTPTGPPTGEATESLPPAPARASLPTLMREDLRGGRIRRERQQYATDAYTRYEVTYPSTGVRVSGILLVPRGRGPFPAVVLNHGYIDPSIYVTGQGLSREQDYLARAGFVVLHTDYRGHAASGPATELARETRLGYTRDAITAVLALKKERYVDPDRVAMLGRSMGGGVTLNALVARPGLVRAAVVFAPVSSRFRDNFERWTVAERPDAAAAFYRRFGRPAEDPAAWRGLSARTYFDRIAEPVLILHGTRDESCPIAWSRTTQRLLRAAGVRSTLAVYDGEQHAFGPQWPASMRRTVAFLRRQLA